MRPADVAAVNRQRSRRPHHHTSAAIEHLHQAVLHEPDPAHKAKLTGALNQLMQMQAAMMAPPKPGASGGE